MECRGKIWKRRPDRSNWARRRAPGSQNLRTSRAKQGQRLGASEQSFQPASLQSGDAALVPRVVIEDVQATRRITFHLEDFVGCDAITSSTKRLAKIIAAGQHVLDRSIVGA